MKYILAIIVAIVMALSSAAPAAADEVDNRFFYTLMKQGIVIGDWDAALSNVARICGRIAMGQSVDTLAAEMDAAEPGLGFEQSRVFVLTALQFYCIPDANALR